jgi:hypothetical protein
MFNDGYREGEHDRQAYNHRWDRDHDAITASTNAGNMSRIGMIPDRTMQAFRRSVDDLDNVAVSVVQGGEVERSANPLVMDCFGMVLGLRPRTNWKRS